MSDRPRTFDSLLTAEEREKRVLYDFPELRKPLEFARKFRLRHPLYGAVRMEWSPREDGLHLRIFGKVPDRDTGRPVEILQVGMISRYVVTDYCVEEKQLVDMIDRFVRTSLRDAVLHEIDEMLEFDGKQIRDPHAAKAR